MSDIILSHGEAEALDRAKETRRADNAWTLDKIVFVVVLALAFACSVFAAVLPIYVWVS